MSAEFDEAKARLAATAAWIKEQGKSRQREEMFMDGALWQFERDREALAEAQRKLDVAREIIEHKNKTISVMEHELFIRGVNFDYATGDEQHERIEKALGEIG